VVETAAGRLAGVRLAGGRVTAFLGVPYARAGRFRAPRPPAPWTGVRWAAAGGPWCVQPPPGPRSFHARAPVTMGEDCQWLNVWAPSGDGGRRPVLVWFHGGNFVEGSAGAPLYDGAALAADRDVVVVGVNHRLGLLGYAAHEQLRDEETGGSGNWALLDQLAALAWIRDHIEQLGGDPGNVTLFGQSAGAMTVCALLASPPARGLFHRAVLQSGGPSALPADRAGAALERLVRRAGLADVAALRSQPPDRVLQVQRQLTLAERRFRLGPVVDGRVLPQHPLDAARAGSVAPVPVIVGTSRDEVRYVYAGTSILSAISGPVLRRRLAATLPAERAEVVAAAYAAALPGASPGDLWVAIETDRLLRAPAFRFAGFVARHRGDVFGYVFDHRSPDPERGACHGLDLPLLFGTAAEPVGGWVAWDEAGRRTAAVLRQAWGAFARTGRPRSAGGPWPALRGRPLGSEQGSDQGTVMRVCADDGPVALDPPGVLTRWEDADLR
jgi:para-nitrobenzyl esterase